jgi:hypothetical protein
MKFDLNGPVTQKRAEDATEWLVHNAKGIAVAKANRDRCENRLRVIKSLAMKASGEKSAAAQEREAYASDEYQGAIDDLFQATVEHEELIATRLAAQEVINVWRSINSNLRGVA